MQSHTRRVFPTYARIAADFRTGSGVQTPPEIIDNGILQALDETAFASVRKLAKSMCISGTTVWQRLTRSLGFAVKHLHWVLHRFTDAQRQIRIDQLINQSINQSNELLRLLESVWDNGWKNIMTLNESWFYLWTSHEIVWVQAGQPPSERVKHMIEDRKMMVTIV
jgi:hypothetical protein